MKITRDMMDYDDQAVIVTVDGKRYQVTTENDYDSSPTDLGGESYSEEDLIGWRGDLWYYVGVIVTPLDVPEDRQFEYSNSLWGVEFDFHLDPPQTIDGHTYRYTDMDYMCMVHPVPDMIYEVIANVREYETEMAIRNYIFS